MFGRSIITESGSFSSIRTRSFVSLEDEVSQEQNRTENCAQRRVSAGPVSDAPASVRYAINYWQSSGLFQSRSGDPLTVTSRANNNSLSGQNRDRAYLIGNPYGGSACSPTAHCKSFLNPALLPEQSTAVRSGFDPNLRQYRQWLLYRTTLHRRGYGACTQLSHSGGSSSAIPR
jgi:hypothetical protein